MSVYRFVLRNLGGQAEELGFMSLPDDREAVAFGETVVRGMVEDHPTPHEGTVMVVIDGAHERTVEEIPLAAPTMWSESS